MALTLRYIQKGVDEDVTKYPRTNGECGRGVGVVIREPPRADVRVWLSIVKGEIVLSTESVTDRVVVSSRTPGSLTVRVESTHGIVPE